MQKWQTKVTKEQTSYTLLNIELLLLAMLIPVSVFMLIALPQNLWPFLQDNKNNGDLVKWRMTFELIHFYSFFKKRHNLIALHSIWKIMNKLKPLLRVYRDVFLFKNHLIHFIGNLSKIRAPNNAWNLSHLNKPRALSVVGEHQGIISVTLTWPFELLRKHAFLFTWHEQNKYMHELWIMD